MSSRLVPKLQFVGLISQEFVLANNAHYITTTISTHLSKLPAHNDIESNTSRSLVTLVYMCTVSLRVYVSNVLPQ